MTWPSQSRWFWTRWTTWRSLRECQKSLKQQSKETISILKKLKCFDLFHTFLFAALFHRGSFFELMSSVRMYNVNSQTNKEATEEPYYKYAAMEDEPGGHHQRAAYTKVMLSPLCRSASVWTPRRGVVDKNIRYRLWRGREVGRGLESMRETIQDATDKISEYIRKMASGDKVLSEYHRRRKNKLEPLWDSSTCTACTTAGLRKRLISRNPTRKGSSQHRGLDGGNTVMGLSERAIASTTAGKIRGAGCAKKPPRQSST